MYIYIYNQAFTFRKNKNKYKYFLKLNIYKDLNSREMVYIYTHTP